MLILCKLGRNPIYQELLDKVACLDVDLPTWKAAPIHPQLQVYSSD